MSKQYLKDFGPGFRFFVCEECGHKWKDASRDWTSPSSDPCPKIDEVEHLYGEGLYTGGEPHYEWPTSGGNLIPGYNYGGD